MNEMEFNKIFAAVLVAGILAMFTGFLAEHIVHEPKLEEEAYVIEVAEKPADGAVAAPQGPDPIQAMLASASVEKGEKLSRACAACHTFEKGGPNRIGPNLWNIVNNKTGHKGDFSYSDDLANANATWDYAHLNEFLWKPKKTYAGTKMNFIGLKKAEDRAALVAWLRTLSDSPAPLPAEE